MNWFDWIERARAVQTDATAKAVLNALAVRCDAGGRCHPSVSTIARDTCLSDRSVQRALGRLADCGWLEIGRASRRANTYRLTIGPADRDVATPSECHPRGVSVTPRQSDGGVSECRPTPVRVSPTPPSECHPERTEGTIKERSGGVARAREAAPTAEPAPPSPPPFLGLTLDPDRVDDHRACLEAWCAALGAGMSASAPTQNDANAIAAMLSGGLDRTRIIAACEGLAAERERGRLPRMVVTYIEDRATRQGKRGRASGRPRPVDHASPDVWAERKRRTA